MSRQDVIGLASYPERMNADGNTIYRSVFVELVNQVRHQAEALSGT